MTDFRKTLILTVLSAPAWLAMPVRAAVSFDFSDGTMPAALTVANANGLLPVADRYKRGYTADGWTVDRVGSRGYTAISPTYTGAGSSCDNTLTLPALTVEEGTVLRFAACSVYGYLADDLEVRLLHKESGLTQTILKVDGVPDDWTTYLLPLDCAGEEVELTIAAVSRNGYLLAVDDIFVGIPGRNAELTSLPRVYYGLSDMTDGRIAPEVRLLNTGAPLKGASLIWYSGGTPLAECPVPELAPGESAEIQASLPATADTPLQCMATLHTDGEDDIILLDSFTLYTSDYARTLVVDEATGMWCVNCPEGRVTLRNTERRMGDAMIPLVTHQGDMLELTDYWKALKFYALPYFKLNRIADTSYSNLSKFDSYYGLPTRCRIDVTHMWENADGTLSAEVEVRSSTRFAQEGHTFGVGCTVTADFADLPNSYQKNSATRPAAGPYYYLPSMIPGELVDFPEVTVSAQYAFTPAPGTVKDSYDPHGERFIITLGRDALLNDWKRGRFVAYVMDCESGEIQNACAAGIAEAIETLGVSPVGADSDASLGISAHDGVISVSSTEACDVTLDIWSLSGTRVSSDRLTMLPGTRRDITPDLPAGLYIVRASSARAGVSRKLAL
ncbi:MAG: hypothetical protein HDR80_09955 [Bacteroides sp.]|nr:hypothetical protein [Bacteroides sp.]